MGYCVRLVDSKFLIDRKNKKPALLALRGLISRTDLMEGRKSSWRDGHCTEKRYFSYVDMGEMSSAKNFTDMMEAVGLPIEEDEDGNVTGLEWPGEKLGQEELFLEAISPWVADGSYLEILGEDGSRWRWIFKDGKMTEKTAKVSWR